MFAIASCCGYNPFMASDLSKRQKRLLVAAYLINKGGQFQWPAAEARLGWTEQETTDVASTLINAGYFARVFFPNALFEGKGRLLALDLIDDGWADDINKAE